MSCRYSWHILFMAHSAEEEVARNFICFGEPDALSWYVMQLALKET